MFKLCHWGISYVRKSNKSMQNNPLHAIKQDNFFAFAKMEFMDRGKRVSIYKNKCKFIDCGVIIIHILDTI